MRRIGISDKQGGLLIYHEKENLTERKIPTIWNGLWGDHPGPEHPVVRAYKWGTHQRKQIDNSKKYMTTTDRDIERPASDTERHWGRGQAGCIVTKGGRGATRPCKFCLIHHSSSAAVLSIFSSARFYDRRKEGRANAISERRDRFFLPSSPVPLFLSFRCRIMRKQAIFA